MKTYLKNANRIMTLLRKSDTSLQEDLNNLLGCYISLLINSYNISEDDGLDLSDKIHNLVLEKIDLHELRGEI